MHTQQKEKLINLIDTAGKLQGMLLQVSSIDDRIAILTKCQEVAISVGETLENSGEDDNGIVHLLEEYCEMIFALSQPEEVRKEDISGVQDKLSQVCERLNELPTKYRVVFLPYKADMWDSLESIWRACAADPRCECDVVPIPYFELNREEKKWEPRYDGARFPEEVPVIHYDYYRMDEMMPDVAYIHNPYDDCNHVTTVHPYYYSEELKKNVKKLVYVPYYANAGFIAPDQQALPVCRNMDYMVAQSESAKESCAGTHFYHKILPLGSPKFDKVIRKNIDGVAVPCEWEAQIAGKKTMMLNTTLNDLLNFGEILLKKLKYFFELIKMNDKVALIWRPHPLLEATIKSMRPHLLVEYKELVEFFVKEQIGVYDLTGDVSGTVAIADAYVGSGYSSVINLFGVCGKPIFLFDDLICEEFEEEAKRHVIFQALNVCDRRIFGIGDFGTGIYEITDRGVACIGKVENEPALVRPYYGMSLCDGKLYLSPHRAVCATVYDTQTGGITKQSDVSAKLNVHMSRNTVVGKKIFYLPINDFLLMEYDTVADKWSYHTECMAALWEGYSAKPGEWRTTGAGAYDGALWITTGHTNSVLRFDVDNGEYKVFYIGNKEREFAEVVADEEGLWLGDSKTGQIVRWTYAGMVTKTLDAPADYKRWNNVHGVTRSFSGLLDMGRYLVTIPEHANYMVRFDKETGESQIIARKFLENASQRVNGFDAKYIATCASCVKCDDTHILVQRRCDGSMAVVNVDIGNYEEFAPILSEEDFERVMDGVDGFEKPRQRDYFCRRESRIFTISGFIDDLVEGRLEGVCERQLEALSTLAANLDGTCGEKVHEYMMNVLESGR